MNTHKYSQGSSRGELGRLLRHWRDIRGKSQIELSLDTGVSQRHLSFIESGRSAPSRQTLVNVAQALDVPFRDRNELLVAAGFAPIYKEDAWNAEEMGSVTRALDRILHHHEPFPAIVMDRHWNVFMRNASALRFFGAFIDLAVHPGPRNMLHLMFDPAGMRPFIINWQEASKALIQRIHREAVGHTLDERTRELLTSLLAYDDIDRALRSIDPSATEPTLPMVPLSFQKDGHVLRYFSMITTVGTPQTITTQELRIESMFPADEATETAHRRLMDRVDKSAP
ncbi:MAG: helix-turn-helix domain-containing protein [Lysobacterales bacterium]|jgi:transcriptional regulator with XRE-family HTH domain